MRKRELLWGTAFGNKTHLLHLGSQQHGQKGPSRAERRIGHARQDSELGLPAVW